MANDNEIETQSTDRRSLLKKAAAAGTVAWTTPLVTSSIVSAADGTCTPKCRPTSNALTGSVNLFCTDTGEKWAQVTLNPSGTCPCASSGAPTVCIQAPAVWAKGGATEFAETACISGGTILVRKQGNGALGNGTYTGTATIGIGCRDRNGDFAWSVCSYTIVFTFAPANGPCSATTNVGTAVFTLVAGSCTTACTLTSNCPFTPTPAC